MAITAMGIGTKTAPADVNLDPQSQFWSFLTAFVSGAGTDSDHSARAYFSGFRVRQNDPVGMSVLVGGEDGTIDSAAFKQSNTGAIVLLSTDGTPQEVTIATAPASGSRIDAIVSYIDKTNADATKETAGTPQYVKTIAVQGTAAASNPVAPTNDEITAALPTGVGGFYRWADVKVGQGVINITDDNVSDAKPASPNVYSGTQRTALRYIGFSGLNNFSGSTTNINSVTLPAGKWYVEYSCQVTFDAAGGVVWRGDFGYSQIVLGAKQTARNIQVNVVDSDGVTPLNLTVETKSGATVDISQNRIVAIPIVQI